MGRVSRSEDMRLIVAYNLRKQRQKKFPSAKECAEANGVKQPQWSTWECAIFTPVDKRLGKIAKVLGTSIEDLKRAPDNWKLIKDDFKAKIKYKNKDDDDETPVEKTAKGKQDKRGGGDETHSEYMEIVSALATAQSSYDRGEMPHDEFLKKMQAISEFVHYQYRGILPEK